jgi:hypothetical protein
LRPNFFRGINLSSSVCFNPLPPLTPEDVNGDCEILETVPVSRSV